MHGVRGANYVGADDAHMRRASAWCVDKHGKGSVKLTATRIPVVGMQENTETNSSNVKRNEHA